MQKKIFDDGGIEGGFSKNKNLPYPHPKEGENEYEYHKRVNKLKEQGFHLGDLSWGDWIFYCMGSGYWRDSDPSDEMDESNY